MGSSVTKRCKSWEKVPILGSYLKFRGKNLGYLSFILLEAKSGAPTRISGAKYGAKPPNLLIMEVPPWEFLSHVLWVFCSIFGNSCPWGGVLARFICPRGQSFALSLGGEFTLSKEFPGGSSGGWSGLELTYTLFSTVEIKI